jgi:hypothetical protein
MKKKTDDYRYSIKQLLLFNISTLAETFIMINNCNRVKDLELEMKDPSSSKFYLFLLELFSNFLI